MEISFTCTTFFNGKAKTEIIKKTISNVQGKLDAQILKDSNFYCPMDSGMLIKSGIVNTVIGSGLIVWKTPYARMQYYSKPNKSHQKNPNARMEWFKVAKGKRIKVWEKLIHDEYHKNSK